MSHAYAQISSTARSAKIASLGALFLIAFGANFASAQPHKVKVDPRAMQAYSASGPTADRYCAPANGAQIWGGFATVDDLVNERTGEICGKR